MRGLSVLCVALLVAAGLPASGQFAPQAPQVFFRDDFESGAEGWWGDPYWRLSGEHVNSGANSLHFGDPEQGVMFCEEVICQLEVRSPVFVIPAESPAYLYFWAYLDIWGSADALTVDVETIGPRDEVLQRDRVFNTSLGQDWVFHANISSFAGNEQRLVFTVRLYHVHEWDLGVFVDDVVVTDRHVVTESVLAVSGEGAASRVTFDVLPGDRKIIELRVDGEGDPFSLAAASYSERDGEPAGGWAMSTPWWVMLGIGGNVTEPVVAAHVGLDLVATVLNIRLVDQDLTLHMLPDGRWWLSDVFMTNGLEPGRWDRILTVYKADELTATVIVRTQSPGAVAAAVGGATIALGHSADLDANLFVGSRYGPWALVGGRGSWWTDAPSLGFFSLYAALMSNVHQSSPDGPFPGWLHYTDESGEWTYQVDHAVNPEAKSFSSFHINTVPPRPAPEQPLVPDLSGVPFGPRAGDVRFPAFGERTWSLRGSIGCQLKALGLATDGSCGLFPLVWHSTRHPLVSNGGLIGIDYRLESDLPVLGTPPGTTIGDTCVIVDAHVFKAQGCQTGGGRVTLIEGDPLLSLASRIDVALEKDETGAAFLERSFYDLVFRYDLALVPPLSA